MPTKVLALDLMVTLKNTYTKAVTSGVVVSLEKVGNAPDIHLEYADGLNPTWSTYTPGTPIVSKSAYITARGSVVLYGRVYIRVP